MYVDVDTDPRPLGFDCQAILWLSVPPSELAAVGQALATHPEIAFAAATTGPASLVCSVLCRTMQALYSYVTDRLGALRAIQHIEISPVIRTLKSSGSVHTVRTSARHSS